jgi:adenylate cyclase
MHEIERKFLVTETVPRIVGARPATQKRIEQAYLSGTGEWTIRVRKTEHLPILIAGDPRLGGAIQCVQTMKKKVTDRTCVELEHEIDRAHFDKVLSLCGPTIVKTRTSVRYGDHLWEIDEFPQFNGLIVAEIELKDENEHFDLPPWLGKEVTHKKKYRNRQMAIMLEELTT